MNKVFGYRFENANEIKQNVEAIDLINHVKKRVCQVSATSTKQKVELALSKILLKQYPTYRFKIYLNCE
ncbi:MAG: SMEK domain-containing protein [Sphingobacteriaceae bacterium]